MLEKIQFLDQIKLVKRKHESYILQAKRKIFSKITGRIRIYNDIAMCTNNLLTFFIAKCSSLGLPTNNLLLISRNHKIKEKYILS